MSGMTEWRRQMYAKFDNIMSGHNVNEDDRDWLRSLLYARLRGEAAQPVAVAGDAVNRARDLLAAEYDHLGYSNTARRFREFEVLSEDDDAVVRVIARCLSAAPAAPECPEGWQSCTPEYVAKHGDCATAPRVSFRNDVRSHYHPIRDGAPAPVAGDPIVKRKEGPILPLRGHLVNDGSAFGQIETAPVAGDAVVALADRRITAKDAPHHFQSHDEPAAYRDGFNAAMDELEAALAQDRASQE